MIDIPVELIPKIPILVLTIILILLSAGFARRFGLGRDISLAGTRALIQILILASIILLLFELSIYWSVLMLLAMAAIAGHTTYARSGKLEKGLPMSIMSIVLASVLLLTPFFLLDIFPLEARYLIPTGSIFIGNAMNISSLAIDRYKGEIKNKHNEIEAYLALGATPKIATASCLTQGINSALIPSIDNMKNLGLVWIPGVMTGLLLGGADPLEAASIQIALFTSIMAAGMLASSMLLHFSTESFFTGAWQLRDDFE